MKISTRARHFALVLFYAAAFFAPGLHDLAYADDPCAACDEISRQGTRVEPLCDAEEGCENPQHHHHHRHVHGHCLSCQPNTIHGLFVSLPACGLMLDGVIRRVFLATPSPSARDIPGLYLARAPPRIS